MPDTHKPPKKIVVFGLDNSGKTSIILSLKGDQNLLSYYSLKPTTGIQREKLDQDEDVYYVWDFGGQEQYRKRYLAELDAHLKMAQELLFVVDVQDVDRFPLALAYFGEILDHVEVMHQPLEILIYLHKYDPVLPPEIESPVKERLPAFIEDLKARAPAGIPVQFFRTSIYTTFSKTPL